MRPRVGSVGIECVFNGAHFSQQERSFERSSRHWRYGHGLGRFTRRLCVAGRHRRGLSDTSPRARPARSRPASAWSIRGWRAGRVTRIPPREIQSRLAGGRGSGTMFPADHASLLATSCPEPERRARHDRKWRRWLRHRHRHNIPRHRGALGSRGDLDVASLGEEVCRRRNGRVARN